MRPNRRETIALLASAAPALGAVSIATMGWDRYREITLARQKQLGVVPANAKLTPRPAGLPAWDSLNADQKRLYARMMEVFAGYGAHVDNEMGRVLDAVAKLPDAK